VLAEEAGIASLSLMDHYLQIAGMGLGEVDAPMLEDRYRARAVGRAHDRWLVATQRDLGLGCPRPYRRP
jgi:hypothetical protein